MSKNTKLTKLDCFHDNLTGLDVSKNTELTMLWCNDNKLTSLDVSKNTSLTYLDCSNNSLTSLDVSKNTKLTHLECGNNELKSLDVSKNTELTMLQCYNLNLKSLDVSKNTKLHTLLCSGNKLTSLDVSKNTKLNTLECYENNLKSLDVSKNTKLTMLNCYENNLTGLDVSKNTKLTTLNCYENNLTSLDVSKNTELTMLQCYENNLTSLDVSKNTKLTFLWCYKNKLTSLDLSKNTKLTSWLNYSNQQYNITVNKGTKEFEYSKFPGGFDKEKVSSLVGATFGTDALIFNTSEITYKYKVRDNEYMNVTLKVAYFDPDDVKSMTVTTQPSKLSYTEGENLSLDGLVVTLKDSNGVTKEVPFAAFEDNNITTDPKDGALLTVSADNKKRVTLTKGKASAETDALTVNPKVFDPNDVKGMTVTSQPTNLKYTEGDKLDLSGLVVTLTDNQGLTKNVPFEQFADNNITATPENGTELELENDGNKVKLTRGNLTAETDALTVKAKVFDPSSGSGSGAGSGSDGGSSAGMNDNAPTTVDKGELNIQIDGAESDSKPGNTGDAAVKQALDRLGDALALAKRVAADPNATQVQVDAAARRLADARKALADALKSQPKKRIGMIPKTGESASFAGLLTVLGFSIVGLVVLCRKRVMEGNDE